MSLSQSYRNLSPKARIGVGLGLLAWGFVGLQLSDRAEERFGLRASDEDREALAKLGPRIIPVDPVVDDGRHPQQQPPPSAEQERR